MSQGHSTRWLEAKNCVRNRKRLTRYKVVRWHEWKDDVAELGGGIQHLRTFVGTWNLCGRQAPSDISSWLRTDIFHHVYAIGTCECERGIGESLVFSSKKRWEKQVAAHLGDQYVMIKSETLAATHLMVFIVTSLVRRVRSIRSARVATGLGNLLGNKGATEVSFSIGTTHLLFINAHLTSGMNKVAVRTQGFHRILKDQQLVNGSLFDHFDHVFFFGDLNFRLQTTRDEALRLIETGSHGDLLRTDQLLQLREAGAHSTSIDGAVRAMTRAQLHSFDDSLSDSSLGEEDCAHGTTHEVAKKEAVSNCSRDTSEHNGAARKDDEEATKKEVVSLDMKAMSAEDASGGDVAKKTNEPFSAENECDGAMEKIGASNCNGAAVEDNGFSREDDEEATKKEVVSFHTKVMPAEDTSGGDVATKTNEPSSAENERNGATKNKGASNCNGDAAEDNGPSREDDEEAPKKEVVLFHTKVMPAENASGGDVATKTNEPSSAENERDGATKNKDASNCNGDAAENNGPSRENDEEATKKEVVSIDMKAMSAEDVSGGDVATMTNKPSSTENKRDEATITTGAASDNAAEDNGPSREDGDDARLKEVASFDVKAMLSEDASIDDLTTKIEGTLWAEEECDVTKDVDATNNPRLPMELGREIRQGSEFKTKTSDKIKSVEDFPVRSSSFDSSLTPGRRQPLEAALRLMAEFSEMPLEFPPTYKFDLGTDHYDTSNKKRVPAYTDRILWKSRVGVHALAYDSVKSFLDSDHRPIFAQFELEVNLDPKTATSGKQLQSSFCEVM